MNKKIAEYIERRKNRKKKSEKPKHTPEEIIELRRKAGRASARKRVLKGVHASHRVAAAKKRERDRLKEKEKLARKKARQKELAKVRKEKEKLRQREIAKRARKNAKKLSKKMVGNTLARRRFFIYEAHNGKIDKKRGLVGKYTTFEKAKMAIEQLKKENESVIFERRYTLKDKMAKKAKNEYIVFRKKFPDETEVVANAFFRNEYGRYVEHKLSAESNFYIIDKIEKKIEDTFWVFGYHPNTDRKTFLWVYENIFSSGFEGIYDIKRVFLYHNKIVVVNDSGNSELIICKCYADAIRFYNMMRSYCKSRRYLFMGNVTAKSALRPMLEEIIQKKTGWAVEKINKQPC